MDIIDLIQEEVKEKINEYKDIITMISGMSILNMFI